MFGYDTGVVSGAMIQVKDQFNLSQFRHELVVAVAIGAAAVAAAIAGAISGITSPCYCSWPRFNGMTCFMLQYRMSTVCCSCTYPCYECKVLKICLIFIYIAL